ncbi:MAG: flagellar biosynthesis anti-sigma factor FlgM [Proteobacteria bacterium]|nr:flagellar biosynthesis anti-sigma factor FlgM [Pseudomonadota bacterium]
MSIKPVVNSTSLAGASSGVGGGGARTGKGATVSTNPSDGDNVQLSPLASQMQAIEAGMANSPVVDAAHVAAIRQAIAEGLFKVNPDVVADHLLATARELLQSRNG